MVILPTPADGIETFVVSPKVFAEIATWVKQKKVQVIGRTVVHGEPPTLLVAYVIDRARHR